MITINQLLQMPINERVGGGFTLTIKATKKYVNLPDGTPIYTVILVDSTGEMLADFKGTKGTYAPFIKGEPIKIIVAQVQAADPSSNKIALQEGKKLYVDQFEKLTQTLSEFEQEQDTWKLEWDKQTRGKVRHGVVCAMIKAGFNISAITEEYKPAIEKLVDYIFNGEQK